MSIPAALRTRDAVRRVLAVALLFLTPLAVLTLASSSYAEAADGDLFAGKLSFENVEARRAGGPDAVGGVGDFAIGNGTLCAVVAHPRHEGYLLPAGGSLVDLGFCGDEDDQLANFESLANLSRSGTMSWDEVTTERSDGEARIVATGARDGVNITTTYILDLLDPTRLLLRTRLERTADGERLFAISDVTVHNMGTMRPFVLARSGHSEGFKHTSTGDASVTQLMNSIVPVKSVTLVGPGGGASPISYTLRVVGSHFIASDGSREAVPTFALSTETLTMLATFVRPYWIGDGDSINVFKLAQSLFMDLSIGEALVFERELRVEKRIDGREVADRGYPVGATIRGQLDTADARIHAFDNNGSALAFVAPDADGSFAFRLPPGNHDLKIFAAGGRVAARPIEVASSDIALGAVDLPAAASVRFPADLAPARLVFRGVGETPDPVFGDDMTGFQSGDSLVHPHLASHDIFLGGFGSDPDRVALAPGQYRVYATRGPEFEFAHTEFTVAAGEEQLLKLSAPLRSVETPGWISADLHIHSAPSDDSTVPMRARLASFLAEGGEVLVSTDHDHISDFAPLIEELGLRDQLRSVVGLEVTGVVKTPHVPFSVGHHNVFPLPFRPALHRAGALRSENALLREIVAETRAHEGQRLVQVNHARPSTNEGGAAAEGGAYFDHLAIGKSYDPTQSLDSENNRSLLEADPKTGLRDIDFDAMELINGPSAARYQRLRTDWFSFLLQGHKKTATGNSDTHSLYEVPNVPRNYVRMADDTPSGFDEAKFIASIGRGAAWVTTGPMLDARLGGATPGETYSGKDATLAIQIRAASWVPVSTVRVFVNGQVVDERALSAPADLEIPLRFEADAFVTVEVEGPAEGVYHEVLPEFRPFAFSNAIFVDANNDGAWSPPGL